jgi:RNA-splicing ligase RtcB
MPSIMKSILKKSKSVKSIRINLKKNKVQKYYIDMEELKDYYSEYDKEISYNLANRTLIDSRRNEECW